MRLDCNVRYIQECGELRVDKVAEGCARARQIAEKVLVRTKCIFLKAEIIACTGGIGGGAANVDRGRRVVRRVGVPALRGVRPLARPAHRCMHPWLSQKFIMWIDDASIDDASICPP